MFWQGDRAIYHETITNRGRLLLDIWKIEANSRFSYVYGTLNNAICILIIVRVYHNRKSFSFRTHKKSLILL